MFTDKDVAKRYVIADLTLQELELIQISCIALAEHYRDNKHSAICRRIAMAIDKILPDPPKTEQYE